MSRKQGEQAAFVNPGTVHPGRIWGPVPKPPPGWTWDGLMDRALQIAGQATDAAFSVSVPGMDQDSCRPEVPVGALVVDAAGHIVGTGVNQPICRHDPTAHAEILALRAAGKTLGNYRLGGCVLVVTLEPCLMCTGAILHARVDGVVFGAFDREAGAISSVLDGLMLGGGKIWHLGGVRGHTCTRLLQDFFAGRRKIRTEG